MAKRKRVSKRLKARIRKPLVPPVVKPDRGSATITSPEIVSARLEVAESELASLKLKILALEELTCKKIEPGRYPSRDALEAMELRKLEKRLTDYLDVEHLEACRITGVTPLFYVLELIDIKKYELFRHPKWVLLPRPDPDKEEHIR